MVVSSPKLHVSLPTEHPRFSEALQITARQRSGKKVARSFQGRRYCACAAGRFDSSRSISVGEVGQICQLCPEMFC